MQIRGYEGLYEVRRSGDVVSVIQGRHNKNQESMILVPQKDKDGYLIVNLYKGGVMKSKKISRLVAECYIPNPENKPIVNHINGDKANNNDWNLEWNTISENTLHGFRVLGRKSPTGGKKRIGKENHASRAVICPTLDIEFESVTEASEKTGVYMEMLTHILLGRRDYYNGLTFKYK